MSDQLPFNDSTGHIPETFTNTTDATESETDREGRSDELRVRAGQITNLSWKQYQAIRQLAVGLGLSEEVAATMPLMAADPQALIDQLKRPRREVLSPGVTGITAQLDAMIASLIRAPENLRMGEARYSGGFRLPRYTAAPGNRACAFDLRASKDLDTAHQALFSELAKIDSLIDNTNPYGSDIKDNGVRQGGILFPLLIGLPGQPWLGGFETADCYGRTYFVQQSEGILASTVLEWLRMVPTTAQELRTHPLQQRRAELLSIAGKVIAANTSVTKAEEAKLMRAVMPNCKVVLTVDGTTTMDEARRRLVAQQHLDRPTTFTPDTEWQTRAEAVLEALQLKNLLATPPGVQPATVRQWLDHPKDAANTDLYADDIAALGVSSLLSTPNTPSDRVIRNALKTRGVTGAARSQARSELTAHVVARAITSDHSRESRRSALERALRMTDLRGMGVDTRPIEEILADARQEQTAAVEERSRGRNPGLGPATQQIAVRAAFYLTCGKGNDGPVLQRSAHGAGKGEAQEPAELLRRLARTPQGLEQLAQAILDGRQGHPIRRVGEDRKAQTHTARAADQDLFTGKGLRELALAKPEKIEDPSASAQVAEDTDVIRDAVEELESSVDRMGGRKDDDAVLPYVEDCGWPDTHKSVEKLETITKRLERWTMTHRIVNRARVDDQGVQ
ncbi:MULTISPECIES: hypothetical protein [unclassified Streptomyces]|uniref:hypothetical protein n=1 Tax=unclassified Streptomyces TaxID=2593676 RepID=UPI001FD2A193|nr:MULTISPECIES: hypothetical protein [unclassified Streptomyces]MDH3033987.1 hypothetical protein [Streptomyces sp. TRM75561]